MDHAPFFSFQGLAFRTTGDAEEESVNIQIAMAKLRHFVMTGADQAEAETALAYLRSRFPRLGPVAEQMQMAFIWDDLDPRDQKRSIGRRAYNALASRLSDMRTAE